MVSTLKHLSLFALVALTLHTSVAAAAPRYLDGDGGGAASASDDGGDASAAEAPGADADAAGEPAAVAAEVPPEVLERRIVAYVATGAAVAGLAAGGVFGFLAWQQYQCLDDVVACNADREEPIVGRAFVDERSNLQHLTLLADMAYLLAGAATIVAVTNYLRGFVFTEEDALTLDMFGQGAAPVPAATQVADLARRAGPTAHAEASR